MLRCRIRLPAPLAGAPLARLLIQCAHESHSCPATAVAARFAGGIRRCQTLVDARHRLQRNRFFAARRRISRRRPGRRRCVAGALDHCRRLLSLSPQNRSDQAESPDLGGFGRVAFRPAYSKTDPYLGTQKIYIQQVEGTVAYSRSDSGAHPMQIKVTYQGCAEAGLCYPPITKVLFPQSPVASALQPPPPRWEGIAILGGLCAFLIAGLLLRKGRRLDLPAP